MTQTLRRFTPGLVLAALLLAAGVAALVWPTAQASSGSWLCVYYSDATFTEEVGHRGIGCCGEPLDWGITTPYEQCGAFNCIVCHDF